jgi:hypothetical protein
LVWARLPGRRDWVLREITQIVKSCCSANIDRQAALMITYRFIAIKTKGFFMATEYTKDLVERRQHKRYLPAEGTMVAVFDTIARIVDISETGLSFICVNWEDLAYEDDMLDILYEESEWLKDIPFTFISRNVLEDSYASNQLHMQRCGIKFRELTPDQKKKFDHLLANHTRSESYS